MFKKMFTMFMLLAFCSMQTAFAADPTAINTLDSNAFADNQQELKTTNSVHVALSPIEKIYNGKENANAVNVLRQVGYGKFKPSPAGQAVSGKYDSSYKLSIGEKLNVLMYGNSVDVISMSGSNLLAPSSTVEIGSNGSIFVSGIGIVKADGRTLGDVERDLNSMARSKYSDMRIKLQVANGGGFSVFIYGEVHKPGKVYVNNNSTVFDALGAAGGVKQTGTLRNIKYNGKSIDLYNTLFLGNDNNIIVKANDKIFVDTIKNTMAIKNGVTTPGIYEFKTGETVEDMIKYAGGLLVTTQRDDVTMVGFDKNTKQKVARNVPYLTAKTTKLSDGDTIQFKELYNDVENTVTIQGNIKHPATYAYKEGMRLSDILKSEDELMEETFIYQAVIRRISGPNNVVETIPVYLKEFFSGMNDPILQPRDVITIYKNTNSKFVDVYGCINTPKHIPYKDKMVLSDVMADIQFMESDVKASNETNGENDAVPSTAKEGESVQIKASTENSNKLIPAEKVAVEITRSAGVYVQTYYLYDIMIRTDRIKRIPINHDDKIFFRTLRDNEVRKTINISGFVKKPGTYSFIKGQRLTDVIEMAGGLEEDADLRGIVFKRANVRDKQVSAAVKSNEKDIRLLQGRLASGYKQDATAQESKLSMIEQMQANQETIERQYSGRVALNIKSNDLSKISSFDNVYMQDGDEIFIPRMADFVSIIGEVYNEQSFIYKKGSDVKYYVKQVGGYTPNASRFRVYKIGINGRSEKVHMRTKVASGDTIVVPRKIAGNDYLTPICQTVSSIANTLFMIVAVRRWK